MNEDYPMGPPVHYCPECDCYPCVCYDDGSWPFEVDYPEHEDDNG